MTTNLCPIWTAGEMISANWGLGAELVTENITEEGAYGAALLAGVGAVAWDNVASACKACIHITGSTQPDPSQMDAYRKA